MKLVSHWLRRYRVPVIEYKIEWPDGDLSLDVVPDHYRPVPWPRQPNRRFDPYYEAIVNSRGLFGNRREGRSWRMGLRGWPSVRYLAEWLRWHTEMPRVANARMRDHGLTEKFGFSFDKLGFNALYGLLAHVNDSDLDTVSQVAKSAGEDLGQLATFAFSNRPSEATCVVATLRFPRPQWDLGSVTELVWADGGRLEMATVAPRKDEILYLIYDQEPRLNRVYETLWECMDAVPDVKLSVAFGQSAFWFVPPGENHSVNCADAPREWEIQTSDFDPGPTDSDFRTAYAPLIEMARSAGRFVESDPGSGLIALGARAHLLCRLSGERCRQNEMGIANHPDYETFRREEWMRTSITGTPRGALDEID